MAPAINWQLERTIRKKMSLFVMVTFGACYHRLRAVAIRDDSLAELFTSYFITYLKKKRTVKIRMLFFNLCYSCVNERIFVLFICLIQCDYSHSGAMYIKMKISGKGSFRGTTTKF